MGYPLRHFFAFVFCLGSHILAISNMTKMMLAARRMQSAEDANINHALDVVHTVVRQRRTQW